MWTSLAGDADYCWLAVRTDPEAKKHKGISMIIVPMDTPGITIQPLHLLGEHDINATFFDDVRVPAKFLVGEENGGWGLITNQLNHERVTLCSRRLDRAPPDDVRAGPRTPAARRPPRHRPGVGAAVNLARVHARLEFLRLINWKVAWSAEQGALAPGRRLDRQGVRHRVLPGVLPAPHGDPRTACVPQGRLARVDPAAAASRWASAARSSSPSAAAPTSCSVTSSPCSASGSPDRPADPPARTTREKN